MTYGAPLIAADDDDLFAVLSWMMPMTPVRQGILLRVELDSGRTSLLQAVLGGGSAGSQGLAISGPYVVLSRGAESIDGNGAILRLRRNGSEPATLATTAGLAAATMVADESNVYFVDADGTKRVPLEGGDVQVLSDKKPFSIEIVDGVIYMAEYAPATSIIAVSASGGEETTVVEAQDAPLYPIACGADLCWTSAVGVGESAVIRRSAGSQPKVVGGGFSQPLALVFDGANFFVASGAGGSSLSRIPAQGGTGVVVHSETGLSDLALNEQCLFWSSADTVSSISTAAADTADSPF